MKKILFLILFLTGLTPVFKNNTLDLICYQSYGQEDPWGDELEDVIICSEPDDITVNDYGSYTITETCVHGNIDGIATNDCEWNCSSVFTDVPPDDNGSDKPDCNGDPGGSAYMDSCGCIGGSTGITSCNSNPDDPGPGDSGDPCGNQIVCPTGQQLNTTTCNCVCTRTCPTGYRLENCECVKINIQPDPDPCTATSIAAGVATTNLLKNNAVNTTMSQMPILTPNNTQQLEHGFNIKNINGIISTTPIREGTATGLPAADYTVNVIADVHDHPAPGTFAPSAQDLFALDAKRDIMSGFTTSYVSSADGNIYALYIDDPVKLNAFVTNNPGFVGSNNNFKTGTPVGDYWLDVNFDLQRQGYSAQEAYTRATTLILQDAGVSLLKTDAQTIDFKKIDIEVVGDDPNGNTIIIINDCN